jgi:hypothetical protein
MNSTYNSIRDKLIAVTPQVIDTEKLHVTVNDQGIGMIVNDSLLEEPLGVAFSHYNIGPSNLIPVAFENGQFLCYEVAEKEERECLDLIFDLREIAQDDLNEWAHRKNVLLASLQQTLAENNMHTTGIAVPNQWLSSRDAKPEFVIFRFWSDNQWVCPEHTEMLVFAPIGQHHCPECGQMVMAGMYHLPKDEL